MITATSNLQWVRFSHLPSSLGVERILSRKGEPLFMAAWERVLMVHFHSAL